MSQDNVELARRWTETYNRRDSEGLIGLNDPEFEMRSVFADTSGGVFRAPDGFPGAYFEALNEAYDHFQVIPNDFIDAGSQVLMSATAEWRGKSSGAQGKTSIFVVFSLRAGKVLREETFTDRTEALEAAGLSE